MNYNVLTWIENFIGAFICFLGVFAAGTILLKRDLKEFKVNSYFRIFIFSMLMVFNSVVFDNVVKIFGNLLNIFLVFKFVFKEKTDKSFIYAVATYIFFPISEIIFALIISIIDYVFNFSIATAVTNSIFSNTMIAIIVCVIAMLSKNKVVKILNKIDKANLLIVLLQGVLTLFVLLSSLNYLYIDDWKFSYKFILNTIIILGATILTLSLLKQYLKNKEVVDKYQLLEEYLKTSAELIEKYSTTNHKYKNNLISIKGYMKSNVEEAKSFVDGLLDNYKNEKYNWFTKINFITFDSIRYLVYYKLSKAEEENLNILVNVDKDIEKIASDLMNLSQTSVILDILGEFFDNSIYASQESKDKEMIFNIYFENKKMVFEISNTYLKEVDLNLIFKNGYTTKGKGHGFGLYEIDKNIKNYPFLDAKYEIVENYFITKLYISIESLEQEKNKRMK